MIVVKTQPNFPSMCLALGVHYFYQHFTISLVLEVAVVK